MMYRRLGFTDLKVSQFCLGTMTWGEQNSEPEAHAQLDAATEAGINFIDTAEMYPVPPKADTTGLTERYLGSWLARRPDRDQLVVATKVSGPGRHFDYLRGGPRLDRVQIHAALDASLKRLQTDYIDLYQIHWPERSTNFFGALGYTHEQTPGAIPIEDTLAVLGELVDSGKVRHLGISNETPWGVARYLAAAEQRKGPRIVSIQNPYNLLNRSFEIALAEFSHRDALGALAYSPLAFGMLSGKYYGGARPPESRLTLFRRFKRYTNTRGVAASEAYVRLARKHNLSPAQMALAWVNTRPFITSTLIAATSLKQLAENIGSTELVLSSEVLADIEAIHDANPNPCP